MNKILYPSPLYYFLNQIFSNLSTVDYPTPIKILDCAAGGSKPPLGLFYEYGFETWGIDISEDQLAKAQSYADAQGYSIDLRLGDMRLIPFDDGFFDYVYEFYSLCHLTKADSRLAIQEMKRVLKPGGLCFVGFMSCHSWPIVGQETAPGEYKLIEDAREVIHSVFQDDGPEAYFEGFDIVNKLKHTTWYRETMFKMASSDWQDIYDRVASQFSEEAWDQMYAQRVLKGNYSHLYFLVRKQE